MEALLQQEQVEIAMERPVIVKAVPLRDYQEELVHVRRQQVVCAHNKIEIYIEAAYLRCADCGRQWE